MSFLAQCLSIARSCLQYLINMAATQKFAILTQTFLPLTISLFSSAFFSKCQLKTFWVFTTRVGVHVNVSSMIFHYHTFFCISKFNAIDKTVTFSGFKMAEHAYYVRKEVFVNVITIKQQPFTPNMKKEKKRKRSVSPSFNMSGNWIRKPALIPPREKLADFLLYKTSSSSERLHKYFSVIL